MKKTLVFAVTWLFAQAAVGTEQHWFEEIKSNGNDEDLYRTLFYMPKGGDLHNHNSGSVYSEEWYRIALEQEVNGYTYFTKTRINNCRDYENNLFPYLLLFRNIEKSEYDRLPECEQQEYTALKDLDPEQKQAWMNSIRLDKSTEGRTEFFESHWQRLNALLRNPNIRAEALASNLKELAKEGALYLEVQVGIRGARNPDGSLVSGHQMAEVFRKRLNQKDVLNTGMTVRLQLVVLRFTPNAERDLAELYQIVVDNRDLVVGINMAGREDNDKGYPLRFLKPLRALRQKHDVNLSIHAGEVDEPNAHVRDTLLLGADRIGHGLNLITDPDTMLHMRYSSYLVEINLISNLLLEYVTDYSQHPFPEYLRFGIPVALSTDDRGMWDSNLTDEFFVAVREFDLSWEEVITLSENSIKHAFLPQKTKSQLLEELRNRIRGYERKMRKSGVANLGDMPETRSFICDRYKLCK